MKPYYQDSAVTIYHGRCEDVLSTLPKADLILTDPPYGINYRSNHNSSHRGIFAKWVRRENLPGIQGDDKPLDPSILPSCERKIIFGGNYCCDKLPASPCWIVWDKRDGIGPNNQADCEMAWTNLKKPARIFRNLWSGLLRAGAENVSVAQKLHPHQKPIALMNFCINYSEAPRGGLILDPYIGSGTTLRAAKDLGFKAIGIELEECYCEIAAKRMTQEVFDFGK